LLLLYKPLHLEAQQVSTRIEVRRHHTITMNAGAEAQTSSRQLVASA
jgi:hypothetical protein